MSASRRSTSSRFWLSLVLIMIVGGLIRLRGYNFALPYIDQSDEPIFATQVLNARGLYAQPEIPGYPPGILVIHAAAQLLTDQITHLPSILTVGYSIQIVRVAAVLTGTFTLLIIGLLARRLGGDVAGLLAATAWAVIPIVVYHSQVALAEPWLILFTVLALYWALVGLESGEPRWFILSVVSGLLAIVFKVSIFPVLGVGVGAALVRLYPQRKTLFRVLGIQAALIILTAVFLFTVNGSIQLIITNRESSNFAKGGLAHITNVSVGVAMLEQAADQIGLSLLVFIVVMIVGFVALLSAPADGYHRYKGIAWVLVLGFALFTGWFVQTYTADPSGPAPRYLLVTDIGFIVLFAAAVVQIAKRLSVLVWPRVTQYALACAAAILWLTPLTSSMLNITYLQSLPDTRASAASWSLNAMDPSAVLVNLANERTFNQVWGGYRGPYRVSIIGDVRTRPALDWELDHVNYVIMPPADWQGIQRDGTRDSNGIPYQDQLILLKQFPAANSGAWRGPIFDVFRLGKMQVATTVPFGGQIALTGYDRSAVQAAPGDALTVRFYWQAATRPTTNYSVFIHLTPLTDQTVLAQADGAPVSANRPTLSWDDPAETLIGQPFSLQIPPDLPAGQYRLLIGLYDYSTGQRLKTDSGDDYYQLLTLTVQPPDSADVIF